MGDSDFNCDFSKITKNGSSPKMKILSPNSHQLWDFMTQKALNLREF